LPRAILVKNELVGFTYGMRWSTGPWRELVLDLKRRGLSIAPELAVADGALGFTHRPGLASAGLFAESFF
jgi:transposase-like protein